MAITKTAIEAILNYANEMSKSQQRLFAEKIEQEQNNSPFDITAMIVNVIANETMEQTK